MYHERKSPQAFADEIRIHCKKSGVRIERVMALAGLSAAAYHIWSTGKYYPSASSEAKVRRAMNKSSEDSLTPNVPSMKTKAPKVSVRSGLVDRDLLFTVLSSPLKSEEKRMIANLILDSANA